MEPATASSRYSGAPKVLQKFMGCALGSSLGALWDPLATLESRSSLNAFWGYPLGVPLAPLESCKTCGVLRFFGVRAL